MPFSKTSRRSFLKISSMATAFVVSLPELVVGQLDEKPKSSGYRLVLFQGDSITDCGRNRTNSMGAVMGQGYPVLVTSRLMADNPKANLMFMNRGISGNKLVDLHARWQQDTIELAPEIVSILIGVNDVAAYVGGHLAMAATAYEEDYTRLLENTLEKLPKVKFVLCEPFLLPSSQQKNKAAKFIHEIEKRQTIVRQLAERFKAVFVPLQDTFHKACELAPAEYWVYDGVHPSFAGHELIAREWVKATSARLV